MTIASTSVKINSRSGPADVLGTSFVCTAAAEGTFADLRTVLLEDEIVQAGDKSVFLLPDGEVVGKSSEAHLKWKTALKGGEVTITRLAHPIDDTNSATLNATESMSTLLRLSDELTRRERLFLVRRSKLGEGINIRDDRGPRMRIVAATPTHVPAPRAPASYPLFYTGVFATPYRSGRQVEFGTISFARPFQIPPRVLVGINGLDFERDQMVRIKGCAPTITTDRARLEVITYDDTIQVASQFSWLAISAADDDIQCGTFESFEAYASGGFQTKIQFNRPYDAPPKVVVWLHHIAADSKIHEIRVKASASDVARDGFDIHVETWDDSVLWYAGVSWLAHSAARTDIASGSYSTWNVHPPQFNDAQKTTSGHVSFGTSLRHAPRSVFVALSALNVSKHHNTRLSPLKTSNVTETGMDWEISTWDDSDLYFADAAFVAF